MLTEMQGTPTGPRPRFPKIIRPGGREILYLIYTLRGVRQQATGVQFQFGPPVQPPFFAFMVHIP